MKLQANALFRSLPVALCIGVGTTAWAAAPQPILSGSTWTTYTLAGAPMNAFAPYPNNFTLPDPATTNAQLMWAWGGDGYSGTPTGGNGPTFAIFSYTFSLDSAATGAPAGAWIAADDYMVLAVNGVPLASYSLDLHKLSNNQPDPVYVSFAGALNAGQNNTLTIFAYDGAGAPANRGNEWVFFDAQATAKPSFISAVPEPETAMLLVSGLICLPWLLKRRGNA